MVDSLAGQGSDTMAQVESLTGSLLDDRLTGDEGPNVLLGGPGDDALDGGGGQDTAHGERGDDTVVGGPDRDLLWGEVGDDTLSGGTGHDDLYGGPGADRVGGDAGNDYLRQTTAVTATTAALAPTAWTIASPRGRSPSIWPQGRSRARPRRRATTS